MNGAARKNRYSCTCSREREARDETHDGRNKQTYNSDLKAVTQGRGALGNLEGAEHGSILDSVACLQGNWQELSESPLTSTQTEEAFWG